MSETGHGSGSKECREIFARLSDYVDDELPRELCDGLERHLQDCPPCQAFLESLRRTVRWIEEVEAPPLPGDVRRRILAAGSSLPENGDAR